MNLSAAVNVIPRSVRSFMDMRKEPRIELDPDSNTALLLWRGDAEVVHLGNISASGAMFFFDKKPNLGERVVMEMANRERRKAQVMWVRDGKVGLSFEHPAR